MLFGAFVKRLGTFREAAAFVQAEWFKRVTQRRTDCSCAHREHRAPDLWEHQASEARWVEYFFFFTFLAPLTPYAPSEGQDRKWA